MLNDETRYHLLKELQSSPDMSQRELAGKLGISLGKVNYCLRALIEKGWVKAINFKSSPNKARYLYQLTPTGLEEKAQLTMRFLKIKQAEFEAMKAEINALQQEGRIRRAFDRK